MRTTAAALLLACTVTVGATACSSGGQPGTTTSTTVTSATAPADSSATDGATTGATSAETSAVAVSAGTTVEGVTVPTTAVMTDGEAILTPDGRYTVSFGTSPTIEDGGETKAAPQGGTWLLYTIEREAPERWESPEDVDKAGQSTTVSLVRGSEVTAVAFNKDQQMSGARAVAIDGDGKDVAFRFGYDGLEQQVGPDGKRDPQVAAASYLAHRHGEGATVPFALGGNGQRGMKAEARLEQTEITVSAYDKAKKWAQPGKAWVVVTGEISEYGVEYLDDRGTFVADYGTVKSVADVTLAGVKPVSQAAGDDLGTMRFLFELPVDQVQDSMPFALTVRSQATRRSTSSVAPAQTTLTYTFKDNLGLTE